MGFIGDIFGGGSQTVVQQANLSSEQSALIQKQIELADFQIKELNRQRQLQRQAFAPASAGAERLEQSIGSTPFDFSQIATSQPGGVPPGQILPPTPIPGATPAPQVNITPPVAPGQPVLPGVPSPGQGPTALPTGIALSGAVGPGRQLATEDLSDQLIAQQLERLQAGGQATPQEVDLINDAVSRALAAGETDIERFQTESTERLREELAPQLGLRPSDTPILDRGGRVAAEAVRQQGQLVNSLEGQRAQALLNFPLERAGLLGGLTAQQQGLSEGALGLTEQQRQFGGAFGEQQRQFGGLFGEQQRQLGEQQRQFDVGAGQFGAQLGEAGRQFNIGQLESGRQFGLGLEAQLGQFGAQLGEAGRQFNVGTGEQQRQFGAGIGEGQRQFDVGASEQQRQFQEQLSQNIRNFQSQLQQSAFSNRLQLAGAQSTAGLGLAGVAAPNIGPAFANTGSTQTIDRNAGFGQVAGGIGGLLLGLGSLGFGGGAGLGGATISSGTTFL